MTRKRRKFSAEFKRKAVQLTKDSERSVAEIAKDVDISETALRRWMAQYEADAGEAPEEALMTSERQELRELRRKVRTLEMEREVLKKAAAFFAKEST